MKTLEKVHAKLSREHGRKMAASDVKIMMTTIELRNWVNAQRRTTLAAERVNAEQVKRSTLGEIPQDKKRIQGRLPLDMQGTFCGKIRAGEFNNYFSSTR